MIFSARRRRGALRRRRIELRDLSREFSLRLPDAPQQLGAVERFRITGAFDSNGDGAPDLLEVNDRFAYLLEPDGRLFVVRVGLGC